MSVWIELHCQDAQEGHAEPKEGSECWTHRDKGLGEYSAHGLQEVVNTYKRIWHNAIKAGWRKVDGEWVCPHCMKHGHHAPAHIRPE